MTRLWDKGAPLDTRVLQFTAGEDYGLDERLVSYDVRASIAHAEMLHTRGLLEAADLEAIRTGLQQLAVEHAAGQWHIDLADEDGQTALEQRLTARIGAAGGRVHLGRSRNDQVLTAVRLYLRDAAQALSAGALRVADELDALAARQGEVALPGYTHMQQAMPSSVALWAGGFAGEVRDDAAGLLSVLRRIDRNPLGSAAGYGAPGLGLDRELTRAKLDFAEVQEPVTSVQLSRGKAEAQLLFEITLVMQDMGRLASDLLLFYTQEFAFVQLPDAFTTGSSIMPQKRNPDVFELLRGRTASAHGCLVEALGIFAKLPSGYQRDLQLLKQPLFRGIDLCMQSLDILAAALPAVSFNPERIVIDPSIRTAEEAYALVVTEGIPFREAYRRVGARLKR
jgi:argininosuccinate lyase